MTDDRNYQVEALEALRRDPGLYWRSIKNARHIAEQVRHDRAQPWWRRKVKGRLPKVIKACLRAMSLDAERTAKSRLTDRLTRLADRFAAHVASIYIAQEDGMLVPVALYHLGRRKRNSISTDDQGVVPRVARDRQTRIVDDVASDPDYFATCGATQSEIAIPILWQDTLLGVLNLEFRNPLEPLRADEIVRVTENDTIPTTIVDLLYLRQLSDPDRACPWHPLVHGWNLATPLARLLTSMAEVARQSSPSFTLWCPNWSKDTLHAYATHGYDAEYTSKALKLSEAANGRALSQPGGDPKRLKPLAGLTCYFRTAECEPTAEDRAERPKIVHELKSVAPLLARFIETYRDLRLQLGQAHLASVVAEGQKGACNTRIDGWRRRLSGLFSAAASSVFCLSNDGTSLRCVATSGFYDFEKNVRCFDLERHSYDLQRDKQTHTVAAFYNQGTPIHQDALGNFTERGTGVGSELMANPNHAEFIPGEELRALRHSGRKLLACRFVDPNGAMGVVRRVRGENQRPFTEHDRDLLKLVCQEFVPFVNLLESDRSPIESPSNDDDQPVCSLGYDLWGNVFELGGEACEA